jgi:AraC family transcriptional activator FtrA
MLLASFGRRHTVSVLAFDGMAPFELGAVVEVFGLPRPELEIPWYDLRVCSLEREPMRAVGGFMMTTQNGLDVFAGADTVMVVAVPDVAAVGFDSPVTFRHHFTRVMKTPPSAYRRTFRATA